MEATVAAMF